MEQREYLNHCPHPDAQAACVGNKVLSRNANGTIAMTSQPSNESELQLYRVLQRANLLSYYDTFIGQGGDDVQQLCEAGEEEFLEIMALVGMASKPLHVRRLQKALQEWVSNPAMFQTPLVPSIGVHGMPPLPRPMNLSQHGPPAPPNLGLAPPPSQGTPPSCAPGPPPGPSLCSGIGGSGGGVGQQCGSTTPGPSSAPMAMMSITPIPPPSSRPSPPMQMVPNNHPPSPSFTTKESIPSPSSQMNPQAASLSQCSDPGMGDYGQPGSPLQLTPVLVESQIQRLSEAAELLVKTLPPFEPKPQNTKKKICKELEQYVMNMAEDDPRRMEEIRKYAAIYGRFDCKRKPEKPLTLHEVSVNEAAAQICRHIPALLTRRDELFPLARQVVRDSGYQYSKGHSNWGDSCRPHGYGCRQYNNGEDSGGKRPRMDQGSPDGSGSGRLTGIKRQERLESISEELKQVGLQQDEARMRLSQQRDTQDFTVLQQLQQQLEHLNGQQVQLMAEQSELMKRPGRPRHDPEYGQNSDTQQPWPGGYGLQARLSPRSYYGKGNGRISSCSDPDRPDSDDTDSQYSFSNASSPSQDIHDSSSQDYCSNQSAGDLRGVPVADMLALKHKKANAQITKQMMQETLMDEGLRVVKELSNQIKEEADGLVLTGLSGLHHHHPHPPHQHPHPHQHHYPQHHQVHHHDQQQHHQQQQQMRGRPASFPGHHVSGNNGSGSSSATPPAGGHCGPMASHQNGQSEGGAASGANSSGGNGGGGSSSDVEKAAANTINALLSLSQTAGASGPSSGSARASSNNPNASHSHSPHTHSHHSHSHSQSQSHNPHNVNNPVPGTTVKQEMSSPMGLKSD